MEMTSSCASHVQRGRPATAKKILQDCYLAWTYLVNRKPESKRFTVVWKREEGLSWNKEIALDLSDDEIDESYNGWWVTKRHPSDTGVGVDENGKKVKIRAGDQLVDLNGSDFVGDYFDYMEKVNKLWNDRPDAVIKITFERPPVRMSLDRRRACVGFWDEELDIVKQCFEADKEGLLQVPNKMSTITYLALRLNCKCKRAYAIGKKIKKEM